MIVAAVLGMSGNQLAGVVIGIGLLWAAWAAVKR